MKTAICFLLVLFVVGCDSGINPDTQALVYPDKGVVFLGTGTVTKIDSNEDLEKAGMVMVGVQIDKEQPTRYSYWGILAPHAMGFQKGDRVELRNLATYQSDGTQTIFTFFLVPHE